MMGFDKVSTNPSLAGQIAALQHGSSGPKFASSRKVGDDFNPFATDKVAFAGNLNKPVVGGAGSPIGNKLDFSA